MSDYKDITEVQGSMLKEKPWSPLFNAIDAMSVQTYMLKMADNRIVWENNVTKLCAENMNSMWGQLEAMSEAILCINDSFNAFQEDVANLYKYISSLYDKIIIAVTNNFKNMLEVTLQNSTEIQDIITNQIRNTTTLCQCSDSSLFTNKDNYMYLNDVQIAYYHPYNDNNVDHKALDNKYGNQALICFLRPEVNSDQTIDLYTIDANGTKQLVQEEAKVLSYLQFETYPYRIIVEGLCKAAEIDSDRDTWVTLSDEEYSYYANNIRESYNDFPRTRFVVNPYDIGNDDYTPIFARNYGHSYIPILCDANGKYPNSLDSNKEYVLNLSYVTTIRIKVMYTDGTNEYNWSDTIKTDQDRKDLVCEKSTIIDGEEVKYTSHVHQVKLITIYNKRGNVGVSKSETERIDFDRFLKQSLSYGESNPDGNTKGLYYFKIINQVQGS